MKYRIVLGLMLGLAVVFSSTATADSREFGGFEPSPPRVEALGQFSFGADLRLGGDEQLDKTASMTGNWFMFVSNVVGFRSGLRYNNHTGYNLGEVRTLGFDFDLRLQVRNRRLSPFFEAGLSIYRYNGSFNGHERTKQKGGVNVAVGLSWSLGQNGSFDLTLRQVANHIEMMQPVYATDDHLLPPEYQSFEQLYFVCFGHSASELYNPTTLELNYRLSIF